MDPKLKRQREFLRAEVWREGESGVSAEARGLPQPPMQKAPPEGAAVIRLPDPEVYSGGDRTFRELLALRKTSRYFTDGAIPLDVLSFVLWSTQGVRSTRRAGVRNVRNVPAPGALHPFETYIGVQRVTGLAEGIYQYLPLRNSLALIREMADIGEEISRITFGQPHARNCAAALFWSVFPARMEWRYHDAAAKVIAIAAGHVAQNLYLSAAAARIGACAIASVAQGPLDRMLGLDGVEEFGTYMAVIGKTEEDDT